MKLKVIFISLLGLYLLASTSLVYIFTQNTRILHAVIGMGLGLIILWVIVCGGLMYVFRDKIKRFVRNIPMNWQIKFVVFCIGLALLEEVITTLMTNLAPFFGVHVGEAYITASTNFLDIVSHHSVIVFVPWFIAWAWILKRYEFSSFWVFVLFGLNGLFAESLTFGWAHASEFALWIFVYGLMIWLPAYCVPAKRGARLPTVWHGMLAFLLPLLIGIPWAIAVNIMFPDHPAIHFPPLQG